MIHIYEKKAVMSIRVCKDLLVCLLSSWVVSNSLPPKGM